MATHVDESGGNGTGNAQYLLKVALLTVTPLALVSVVAGSPAAGLMALPAFGIVFGIEVLRTLVGWPSGEASLWWVGAVLLIPTAFSVPTAVSMRLDPTVPQAAMVALVFLLPILTLGGYLALAGADRWLRAWRPTLRWAGLVLIGLVLGGGLPAWVFVRGEIQEARVQTARETFLKEAATLSRHWTLQAEVADVEGFRQKALARARDSILTLGPAGKRRRAAPLSKNGLPFLDTGQLDGDSLPEMVVHGEGFNDTLRALDHNGRLLWSYSTPQGTLGSVATTDLDGDGQSEIVAGSTTGAGLRLLSPSGQTLWVDTTLWVSDIRAVPGGAPSVGENRSSDATNVPSLYVATAEEIRGYRGDGSPTRSLVSIDTVRPGTSRPGFTIGTPSSASPAVGSTDADASSPGPVLVAGARGPDLVAYALPGGTRPAGEELWRRRLPSSSVQLAARGNDLAAVGGDRGRIYVFDLRSGTPVAVSPAGGTYLGAEWMVPSDSADRPPLLLGWTENELVGLRLPESRTSGRQEQ